MVSKKPPKEKKSKSKEVTQVPNGLTKSDKKRSESKGKVKKIPPAKQASESDVSVPDQRKVF